MTSETYFQLEGEFLGVCALDGYKLKYMRLRTTDSAQGQMNQGDLVIKIPKELRLGLVYRLTIGDRLRCEGTQKDGKLKAQSIEKVISSAFVLVIAAPEEHRSAQLAPEIEHLPSQSKVKILICQKSHCRNNGGNEVYSALTAQLNSHNLNDSVTLQSTGCLKCCKKAPNLVISSDRSHYHNVKVAQVQEIVSKVRSQLSVK